MRFPDILLLIALTAGTISCSAKPDGETTIMVVRPSGDAAPFAVRIGDFKWTRKYGIWRGTGPGTSAYVVPADKKSLDDILESQKK